MADLKISEMTPAAELTGESGNSTGSTGGTETRPRNVSMMYIIKT